MDLSVPGYNLNVTILEKVINPELFHIQAKNNH